MRSRTKFMQGELEKTYQQLNVGYEHCPYSQFENDKRFLKIFQRLFEINDKVSVLRQVVKGSYLIL